MMADRIFNERRENYGDRGSRIVAEISCGMCGAKVATPTGAGSSSLPYQVIARKFTALGWRLGNANGRDECPKCIAKNRAKTKEMKVLKVVDSAVKEPPRVMSRDDRRIIFEKLNDTYVDEKTGYDSGWSDHRLATDLGVPRKWVEQVREEMFGPIGTNAEMNDFLAQAQALLKDARSYLEEAQRVRDEVTKLISSPSLSSANTIFDRISKIDRLAQEVRKLVVTS
jgi:hypothetical protein